MFGDLLLRKEFNLFSVGGILVRLSVIWWRSCFLVVIEFGIIFVFWSCFLINVLIGFLFYVVCFELNLFVVDVGLLCLEGYVGIWIWVIGLKV